MSQLSESWQKWHVCSSCTHELDETLSMSNAQAHWRGREARRQAQRLRAAITLQRLWRGVSARRQLADQQDAATVLQAAWRGTLRRRAFLRARAAAVQVRRLF